MSIEKELKSFIDVHNQAITAFEKLKSMVKEEGSKVIQEHIRQDKFELATSVVNELTKFTTVSFESNITEVSNVVQNVFDEIMSKKLPEEQNAPAMEFMNVNDGSFTSEEQEALKTIGYSGTSRLKDSKGKIKPEVIEALVAKGVLTANDVTLGNTEFVTFELNGKGKEQFRELFQLDPNESLKKELIRKHGDLAKGYFLHDAEEALANRGYSVHKANEDLLEVSKDNIFYYLTPDFGEFTEKDYVRILEKQNKLKSVGFVCLNDETLKNKTEKNIQKWADNNPTKLKFLTINLITVDDLQKADKKFQTMNF